MGRKRVWPPRAHAHKASGQDRVRVNEKDIYLGPTGSAEAARNYAAVLESLEKEQPVIQPAKERKCGLTVAELVAKWDGYARTRYSKEGREAVHFAYACEPLVSRFGVKPAAGFGLPELDEVRDEMIKCGLSRRVINHRIVRIRTVWRWAARKGLVPAGMWEALRALPPLMKGDGRAPDRAPRQACTWAHLAKVCRQTGRTIRAMLLFMWFTAARPGETRRMKAGEIDTSQEDWVFRPARHKTAWRGQTRVVVIGPKARKVLTPYLAGKGEDDYVFPNKGPNGHYGEDTFPKEVRLACERAGMPGLVPYSCRHAAKRRITREGGLDEARAVLGQTSIATTDRYAAGQDEELARRAARRSG